MSIEFWVFYVIEANGVYIIHFGDVVDEDKHLALAHQMYKAGNYEEALDHSNTVYERNSIRTDNLLLLGAIYYQVVYQY